MNKIDISTINLKNKGEVVTLFGFVAKKRKMGELIFVDLRDRTAIIQLVIKKNKINFQNESVLKVKGEVVERINKNPNLLTGEIEIKVLNLEVLSASSYELPFVIDDRLNAKEDTRLKHRYLDLRRLKMQTIIKMRHQVIKAIRDFLDCENFYEIETPILSKSTPEGAKDFIVPLFKKDKFFALPQSPQIYKQLLMIAGFERYFQIAKVFRDEDPRSDRQPEFTQLDIELSYGNQETLKHIIEAMWKSVFARINIKLKTPFSRMNFDDAIENYGTDKPDTRYQYLLTDVKKALINLNDHECKNFEAIKMIAFDKVIDQKKLKMLDETAKKNGAHQLLFAHLDNKKITGSILKTFSILTLQHLFKKTNLIAGTLLFCYGSKSIVNDALGAVRIKLNEIFSLVKDEYHFVWIENWPLYKKDYKTNKFVFSHHPFTMPVKKTLSYLTTNKEKVKSMAYDLVLNGFELGSGSTRINDLQLQKQMFKEIGINEDQQKLEFGFFLEAFKYGVPPHLN